MPELGGDTTLEQCLSEASKAGFTGIESGGKFPKNSKELIPKLEKENLQLCSGWYGASLLKNTPKEEFADRGLMTFAQRINAKGELKVKSNFRGGKGEDWDRGERDLMNLKEYDYQIALELQLVLDRFD